ncbi:ubiquitin-specific protease [Trifolium repens]|nr:ubiquitin-specific protease [Trifolium repens]
MCVDATKPKFKGKDDVDNMMGQALGIENAAHHSSTSTHVPEKCSRQRNSIDCGYFVMRFMKEVVMEYPNKIPDNYFDGHKCPSYSMEKHDEVRIWNAAQILVDQ